MQTRLYNLWEKLRTSFWLIPSSMMVAAIAAFLILLNIDRKYEFDAFLFFSFLEPISASGARVILSTIAGSMITVAGTVFSITIVTLTLASTQFGPRLLRNFMGSKFTQVVLGSFISTFVYCLCLLGSVEPAGYDGFVPGLSVNFAFALALSNVAILIYFIHHVATSIQVETVINEINNDLIKNIEIFFPHKRESEDQEADSNDDHIDENEEFETIDSEQYGYLQAVDIDAIEKLACQAKTRLILKLRAGVYVNRGMPLVCLNKDNGLDDDMRHELQKAFLLGPQRTSEQDVEYSVHQLVEIAVRALSPGVNDPFTALGCIDYLGSFICRITDRTFPAKHLLDEDKNILITFQNVTFSGLIAAAFDQVRQHGRDNAAVLVRLLEVFRTVIEQVEDIEQEKVLLRQAEMVHRSALANIPEEYDLQDIEDRYQLILRLGSIEQLNSSSQNRL